MADEAPAAWPDDVVEALSQTLANQWEASSWSQQDAAGQDHYRAQARAALAVLAPYLAAREAAGWIAGRDMAMAKAARWRDSYADQTSDLAHPYPKGIHCAQALADAIATMAPCAPPQPGADALAERIASAVAAEREAAWNAGRNAAFLKVHECLVGVAESVGADPRIADLPANEAAAINIGFKAAGEALALAARACRPAGAEARPFAKEMIDGR